MKRFAFVCVLLLICLVLLGCRDNDFPDTLPELSDDEMEAVMLEKSEYIDGEVVWKIGSNVLVLKPRTKRLSDTYGETVYIITDEAEEWCVGDYISVNFSKFQRPKDSSERVRIIANTVDREYYDAKPIIYLYPTVPTVCSVKLTLKGELTCTYPTHGEDGWTDLTAYPDGTLISKEGKEYYALYWEGVQNTEWNFEKGFCVKGEDTAEFLEWALAEQGLTRREANEFIVYWLPLMQENAYNVISFQTDAYTEGARLDITPEPDTLIRVFMAYYASEAEVDIEPQSFTAPERKGFTAVEWGGSLVKK